MYIIRIHFFSSPVNFYHFPHKHDILFHILWANGVFGFSTDHAAQWTACSRIGNRMTGLRQFNPRKSMIRGGGCYLCESSIRTSSFNIFKYSLLQVTMICCHPVLSTCLQKDASTSEHGCCLNEGGKTKHANMDRQDSMLISFYDCSGRHATRPRDALTMLGSAHPFLLVCTSEWRALSVHKTTLPFPLYSEDCGRRGKKVGVVNRLLNLETSMSVVKAGSRETFGVHVMHKRGSMH